LTARARPAYYRFSYLFPWPAEATCSGGSYARGNRSPAFAPAAGLRLGRPKPWTPEEDELVRNLPPKQAAGQTGRSLEAVYHRRRQLGMTGRIYLREELMVSVADPSCQQPGQHGAACQVPDWCRGHELVSVARNLYNWCRSRYGFRWWQTYPGIPQALLRERFSLR
jgi:hypothetical protein